MQYRIYFSDLSRFKGKKLKFKYEKFWNNYNHIFNRLETFFGVEIPQSDRDRIEESCCTKNTKKIQSKLSGFNQVDNKTKIHGNHIATPEPFNYKKILTDIQIEFLKQRLHDAIQEWKEL
jgi:hypothetical protein